MTGRSAKWPDAIRASDWSGSSQLNTGAVVTRQIATIKLAEIPAARCIGPVFREVRLKGLSSNPLTALDKI